MCLGSANGSVHIDRVGKRGADIGIGQCHRILFYGVCRLQRFDPVHPVLTAHDFHRGKDLLIACRGDGYFRNFLRVQINRLIGIGISCSLQYGTVHGAVGHGTSGCCHAVYEHVDLTQILFNQRNDFVLDFFGICVAVDSFCIEPVLRGCLFKSRSVIPACRARLGIRSRLVKNDTHRSGAAGICRCNSGGQSVSHGCADHQNLLSAVGLRLCFNILYLRSHIGFAACGMRGCTNKSSYFR